MSTSEVGGAIEEHGTAIDEARKRVRCKYCGKDVPGFNRLKHHLGAVGSDVTACTEVPAEVKALMRGSLLDKKKEKLLKEVGEIYHPNLPLKRNLHAPTSSEARHCQPRLTEPTTSWGQGSEAAEPPPATGGSGGVPSQLVEDKHMVVKEEVKDESVLTSLATSIGSFFYEAGLDPGAVKLPSFQRMIDAVHGCGTRNRVPTCDELQGWILQQEMKEVLEHVEDVKRSWGRTGCSILLDGWTDRSGRNLLRFLVDCPKGTIFLRSVDASDALRDTEAFFLLLCKVIDEVGAQNVVQVIAHDPLIYLGPVGKQLGKKYRSIFWTLSADHCIDMILEKIGYMDRVVEQVLSDAKTITRFIYSHQLPLDLMRSQIQGRDLVKSSSLKSVASFITLGNMVSERENLVNMFSSPMWDASIWASRTNGKRAAELVKDPSFWAAAADVVKITNPLLGVLHQTNRVDEAPMGYIYDAMDRAKEVIRMNLGYDLRHLPYWNQIDQIWDGYLHSPIHSAAYFLNPKLFYSSDFFVDAEVTNGLVCCIVHMVEDQHDQELIVGQLDAYRTASGGFAEEIAVDQRAQIAPDLWWSLFGWQKPELQRLAVKILSQTCSGPAKYRLAKGLSEQLHAERRNCLEQQRFGDMEFVHNNRRLWHPPSSGGEQWGYVCPEELDPSDDWVIEVDSPSA